MQFANALIFFILLVTVQAYIELLATAEHLLSKYAGNWLNGRVETGCHMMSSVDMLLGLEKSLVTPIWVLVAHSCCGVK